MSKNKSQPVCEYSLDMLKADPSFNSRNVVNAAVKRIDDLFKQHDKSNHDLQKADERLSNFRFKSVRQREKLIERHNKELRKTETGRLDSIRQVDQTNAANTAIGLDSSLKTFAATANTNAENIRNQLNSTATTMQKSTADLAANLAIQQAQRDEANNKRFTALEQQQYVGMGKDKVTDPIMEKMIQKLDFVADKITESKGKSDVTDPIQVAMVKTLGLIAEKMAENKGNKEGSTTANEWILRLVLAAIAAAAFFGPRMIN